MRMRRKVLLLLLASLLLWGCGKEEKKPIQRKGDLETTETDTAKEKPTEKKKYDTRNLPVPEPINPTAISEQSINDKVSGTGISVQAIYSYYARQLPERAKTAYKDILQGALKRKNVVRLSKPIDETTLYRIMNILYIDTPEAFALDYTYDFAKDSSGNVEKVGLHYIETPMTWEEYTTTLAKYGNSLAPKTDQLKGAQGVFSAFPKGYVLSGGKHPELLSTAIGVIQGDVNYLGAAKTQVAFLRESGIDAAVMVGNLYGYDDPEGEFYVPPAEEDYKKLVTIVRKDHRATVTCHFKDLYAWVMVKINDQWTHVDKPLSREIERKGLPRESLYFVEDYLIAQSREFYMCELLVGKTPAATSRVFQSLYREGHYIPSTGKAEEIIQSTLDQMVAKQSTSTTYQFADRTSYADFLSKFAPTVRAYNAQNDNIIRDYSLLQDDTSLLVTIYDMVMRRSRT